MLTQNISKGFSREAMKKAVTEETITQEGDVELNELATQVAEQFSADSISPNIISGMVRIIDLLVLIGVGLGLYFHQGLSEAGVLSWFILGSFICGALTVGYGHGMDAYLTTTMRNLTSQTMKVLIGHTLSLLTFGILAFSAGKINDTVTTWAANWFIMGGAYLIVSRYFITMFVKRLYNAGRLERRAVIVGGGQSAAELINSIEANNNSDIRICGIFDDRDGERSPEIVAGYPKLGKVSELVEFCRKARVGMLIVTIPLTAEKRVLQVLKKLWILPIDIRLSAHTNKLQFRQRTYTYEGAVPFVDVFEKPIADWDAVSKRIFDVVVATLAIIVLSPLMLLTALAVKLDSKGPVIFRQKREGFNNELIEIFKFRSLYTDQGDSSGINVVTKGDNRVTRVGRIIRKTSIDELPQLFNVLVGTLSLVGPRPHVANAKTGEQLWTEVVDSYIARHKVKPGVTGWAQINGWRGEIDDEEKLKGRVNADLYYIENWSLLLDLYILAITPFKLMNTENAY